MSLLESARAPGSSDAILHRRQSAYSDVAKTAMRSNANTSPSTEELPMHPPAQAPHAPTSTPQPSLGPPPQPMSSRSFSGQQGLLPPSNGFALTDTPNPTAPNSPHIHPRLPPNAPISGASTPFKARATTLDIPGLTRSKVSPDGRIAQRDIGAKLVIVMVGLPARGKSYIVKKIARYLNWLQHPARIFNVGERRRVAAGGGQIIHNTTVEGKLRDSVRKLSITTTSPLGIVEHKDMLPGPALAQSYIYSESPTEVRQSPAQATEGQEGKENKLERPKSLQMPTPGTMDQSASFFDPENARALQIREQVAIETLDELLDYLLNSGGSVGILDATNSTLERRKIVMSHIRERAGRELNVLFLESRCLDESLLESNMRLKLSGPDYKDQDPMTALEDFKKRVALYEKSYVPLGEYEEKNEMPYVQMIDVGRKVISHQIRGFLSLQAVTYLMNFNLAPRQIWLTRHGESIDNVNGKLGGDSSLTPKGLRYAKALTRFVISERAVWEQRNRERQLSAHFPPRPGDTTPPNPEYSHQTSGEEKNFCVWTSMLRRSVETGQFFDDEEFDTKQMRMLDELNAGSMEGMTYAEIRIKYKSEFELRRSDKLQYRYPGPGGEGYLDVINRLQKVIVEIERMTDHVLIIGHRSVTRVLLAYFKGLKREDVADLDVPLGILYMLEPKPYGVDFKAYRWNESTDWFDYEPDFEMRRAPNPYSA